MIFFWRLSQDNAEEYENWPYSFQAVIDFEAGLSVAKTEN